MICVIQRKSGELVKNDKNEESLIDWVRVWGIISKKRKPPTKTVCTAAKYNNNLIINNN